MRSMGERSRLKSEFEAEWGRARATVLRYCRRAARNPDAAQDILQEVALRAWRGYPSLRKTDKFLAWVLRIAQREVARMMSRMRNDEVSLDEEAEIADETHPWEATPELAAPVWAADVVKAAVTERELSGIEAKVLLARLALPHASWEETGAVLGIAGATCAVIHCRAVPKLCVFLFLYRQDVLGGWECIAQAFAEVMADPFQPLTPGEAEVFERLAACRTYSS